MGHVYGDSTRFPFEINFIDLIRHAVECGVALLHGQREIATAVDLTGNLDQARKAERSRIDAMSDALKLTMTAFTSSRSERMVRTAARILEGARHVIETELQELETASSGQISSTRATVDHAREGVFRAVESFILRHDLPNTIVALRLIAGEEGYSGQALVTTPFGVEAVFALAIPGAHDWGRLRRVAELSASTEVHLPVESGWLSRRTALAPVKLDRLFVTEVALTPERSVITLRRGPRSGSGYRIEVLTAEGREPRPIMRMLNEDGQAAADDATFELEGEDAVHVHRLWTRVVDSTRDLAMRRQTMSSASFDNQPLRELDEPQAVCIRMINVLSPVVQEIAHRSGAVGELVLRRDLGEGRREEIYITKAELHERVMTLPPNLRGIFDPFELTEGPRSPRAPAPSEPIYLDAPADLENEITQHRPKS